MESLNRPTFDTSPGAAMNANASANANAKVHTHVHQPLDTLKAFRRLALPLLLGLASIAGLVVQARGMRRGAETALGSPTGGRLGPASAEAAPADALLPGAGAAGAGTRRAAAGGP